MQLVGLCRQLHYRGVFIIFLIWRLFVDSTQKAVKNQEICEPLQGNLGITQSSGLDQQVVALVKQQHEKALKILTDNRGKLDELAKHLYEKETITGEEFMRILNA